MESENAVVEDVLGAEAGWMDSADVVDDPYGAMTRLRRRDPVMWSSTGHWVVIDRESCRDVLTRPSDFSSRWGTLNRLRYPVSPDLPIHADPPDHARYRAILAPMLVPAGPVASEVGMRLGRKAARELLTAGDSGRCFVAIAQRLAHEAFFQFLGLEEQVRAAFEAGRQPNGEGGASERGGRYAEAISMVARTNQMLALFDQFDRGVIQSTDPGTDRVRELSGQVDRAEFVGLMRLLYAAAVDTVSAQLALMMFHLASERTLRTTLTDGHEQAVRVVDELLRFDSPIAVVREATRDVRVGHVDIASGQMLQLFLNGANRDPSAFSEPDEIVVERSRVSRHLAFGAGIHRCPGASIGKDLLAGVLSSVFEVCPNLRTVPSDPPRWRFQPLRGLTSLVLRP